MVFELGCGLLPVAVETIDAVVQAIKVINLRFYV
jgi:hypothetical protein